ncbi:KaiC domain-containing protein [Halobaculum sp. D14]|uniref:KaiC domain-containing protein n=1 Tax=Halobaculum sp. D14 TaxID=3421642 RepID=UPI003EB93628
MSDDDEDWFERALREEESAESEAETEETEAEAEETEAETEGTEPEAEAESEAEQPEPTGESGGGPTGESGGGFGEPSESGEAERSEQPPGDAEEFGGEATESDPFGGSFADAMDEAPSPGGGDEFGGGSGGDEFGGGSGGDEFGGGGGSGGFGDFGGGSGESGGFGDFGGGGGGGGGGFGDFGGGGDEFGGFGGGGGTDFDEEEFESEIDRIDVGIEGLDEMILGGVPRRSLMTVIGSAGTGKTTFGLQFLNQALKNDGKGVYITLEESRDAIISTAEEKGWPYRKYHDDGDLVVVAMDPIEMANSLDSLRDDISRLVDEFGADRLVLDSVSLLEMMYDKPSKRRSEVFDFARSLKQAGVTTMLTSEASEDNAYASRHGIVEYLTDAVFILQYVRPSDFRETRLAVEIQKIRDANHSRETKPYEITNDGISVYRQANIF